MRIQSCVSIIIALAAAPGLLAQNGSPLPNARVGFFVGFGAGVGNQHFDPKIGPDISSTQYGPTLYFKIGGAASQSIILGAELFGWADPESSDGRSVGSVAFFGQFYPWRDGPFFVKGGFGMATVDDDGSSPPGPPDDDVDDIGFSGVVGVGYDWRIGKTTSLVPTFDLYLQDYNNFRVRIVNIGVGVMFH